jgi:transposase InsO family protein
LGQVRGRRVGLAERSEVIKNIKIANKSGCRIAPACREIGIDKRTFERWRKDSSGDQRRGPLSEPANKLTASECGEIIRIATTAEFMDKPPSQIVPALADKGKYVASESSFYRVLKEAKLNAHRGRSKPATRNKPKALVATAPNQVYSWDITFLKSEIRGIFFYLYFFMDIYSRKIVGYSVQSEQSAEHASVMIGSICEAEGIKHDQLALHSDNGGPMKGATMVAKLQQLGVIPSFSRPSVSDDNPFSESLFRTTKYCPQYPNKPFTSLEAASSWVEEFVAWYNEEHLHSGIRYVTPGSRHRGEDADILEARHTIYQNAKRKQPNRWSGQTRNWGHIQEVFLNCLKGKSSSCNKIAA